MRYVCYVCVSPLHSVDSAGEIVDVDCQYDNCYSNQRQCYDTQSDRHHITSEIHSVLLYGHINRVAEL